MTTSNTHISEIQFKRSSVPNARPTSLLPGEPALNLYDGKMFVQLVNGKVVNIAASPIGNTYYVSTFGSDNDDGLTASRSFKTVNHAAKIAEPGDSVVVASGVYIEKTPILIAQNVQIQGAGERNCIIQPEDPTKDVFWVNNNSYVTGFKFLDRASSAIAFPDEIESGTANGTTNNTITLPSTSETVDNYYIGMEITITSGNGASLIYNKDLCARDVGYMVDSVSFDLLYGGNRQSIQSGAYYYGYDANTTVIPGELYQTGTAYEHLKFIAGQIILGETVTTYQNTYTQNTSLGFGTASQVSNIEDSIDSIINIIDNGPSVAGPKIPINLTANTNTNVANAAFILNANRTFMSAEIVAFINYEFPGFVYDNNLCQRDTGLIIDAITQDLLFDTNSQSTFAGLQYWSQNNYTGEIESQLDVTIGAINYVKNLCSKIIVNDGTGTRYQNLQQQYYGVLIYDKDICARDAGYIVDSISFDLKYGGNRQAFQSGAYYYNYDSTSTAIPGEIVETIDALEHLKVITGQIILGQTVTTYQNTYTQNTSLGFGTASQVSTVQDNIDIIINIIDNGPSVAGPKRPINLTANSNPNVANAAFILNANRTFIAAELNAYVGNTFPSFVYDEEVCARDTGLIVDAIAQDLLFDSTSQSTFSGIRYWNKNNYTGDIENELGITYDAINFLKSLSQKIILNDTSGTRYQTVYTQQFGPAASSSEVSVIGTDFDYLNTIFIVDGPNVTDTIVPNSLVANTAATVTNAYNLLQLNKNYLKAETVAWVQANKINYSFDSGSPAEVTLINSDFNVITNILANGTANITSTIVPNSLTANTDKTVINSYNLLQNNKEYLKAEAIAWVESNKFMNRANVVSYSANTKTITIDRNWAVKPDNNCEYFIRIPLRDTPAPLNQRYTTFIVGSPYIYNCSSISPGGTGIKVDGSLAMGNKSIVSAQFTQFNSGGDGMHILNDGYAQLVGIYGLFCDRAFIAESGGTASLGNCNVNFGNYGLVSIGKGGLAMTAKLRLDTEIASKTLSIYNIRTNPELSVRAPKPYTGMVMKVQNDPDANAYYIVESANTVGDVTTVTFAFRNTKVFLANTNVYFYQQSQLRASGQTYEYVGAGIDMQQVLPKYGGVQDGTKQTLVIDEGVVYATATDQNGDFIVSDLTIKQATSAIVGRTFEKSLFAQMTPYILAIQ
jgi:hypothetical protein